jgi:hypothetical protein
MLQRELDPQPSPLAVTRIHEALRQPNGGADTPQWFNALIRQIRRDGWARGLGRARTDFPQSSYAVKTRMSERHAVSHRERAYQPTDAGTMPASQRRPTESAIRPTRDGVWSCNKPSMPAIPA